MGNDQNAKSFVNRLDNIIYPTLTKVVPGHFDNSRLRRNNSQNNAQTVTRNPQDQSRHPKKRCKKCEEQKKLVNAGRFQNTSTNTPAQNRPVKRSKLKWIGRTTHDIGSNYNTSYEYDQIPLMDEEYAVPVQLIPKSEVETRSTGTPSTSTPVPGKTKITIQKGTKSTSKPGLVSRPKVVKTPPTTTVTPPSSKNEYRTRTWFELPDGTVINEQFTNWQT